MQQEQAEIEGGIAKLKYGLAELDRRLSPLIALPATRRAGSKTKILGGRYSFQHN